MMLTANQVAEKLGFGAEKVRRMCEEGKLPGVNTAREGSTKKTWRVDDKALREWRAAQRNGNGSHAEPAADAAPDGYVTAAEASRISGVKESTLYGQVESGKVESTKVGGRRYFKVSSLKPNARTAVKPVPQHDAAPLSATPGRMLRLLEEVAERTARVEAAVAALQKMWT